MSRLDQHFKESLKNLPDRKLSWFADRRIKSRLKRRFAELNGRSSWMLSIQQLAAVPVALMLMVVSTTSYAFYSPTVVRGDALYTVKSTLETWMYPSGSEDRIAYHLWLSDRRYDEVREILKRRGETNFAAFIPAAHAADEGLSELDKILLETLQRASKNVETAFVISDEIREVKKVVVVKEKIKEKMTKQKQFFAEMKPVFEKMDTLEKPLVVVEQTLLSVPQNISQDEIADDENQALLDAESRIDTASSLGSDRAEEESLLVSPNENALSNENDVLEVALPEVMQMASIADFFDEQLTLQDELLDQMEKTVAVAEEVRADEVVGASVAYVMKSKVREMKKLPSELLTDFDEDGNDALLKLAKVVHEKERAKLDEILVAQELVQQENMALTNEREIVELEVLREDSELEESDLLLENELQDQGTEIAASSDIVSERAKVLAPVVKTDGVVSESNLLTDSFPENDALLSEMMDRAESMLAQPLEDLVAVEENSLTKSDMANEMADLTADIDVSATVSEIIDLPVVDESEKDECTVKAEEICGEKGEECVKEQKEKCEEEKNMDIIENTVKEEADVIPSKTSLEEKEVQDEALLLEQSVLSE
ncbi:MAG: hypothetical protein P1V18_05730 [Candidatus Gracilibacteria bacterium]|nr:hypothetical protein [Candidatus Gracilibacteria bacterium]